VPFAKSFSSDVKCIAVRYPGRRGTHDLASFTSISDLAESACRLLASAHQVDGNVALFGHSMGALSNDQFLWMTLGEVTRKGAPSRG
jgi:surfactin synthase thioesterase subunit